MLSNHFIVSERRHCVKCNLKASLHTSESSLNVSVKNNEPTVRNEVFWYQTLTCEGGSISCSVPVV